MQSLLLSVLFIYYVKFCFEDKVSICLDCSDLLFKSDCFIYGLQIMNVTDRFFLELSYSSYKPLQVFWQYFILSQVISFSVLKSIDFFSHFQTI